MNFIQDKVRNRLKWGKVESLMYVRINLPLVYPKMGVNNNPNVNFVLARSTRHDRCTGGAYRRRACGPRAAFEGQQVALMRGARRLER